MKSWFWFCRVSCILVGTHKYRLCCIIKVTFMFQVYACLAFVFLLPHRVNVILRILLHVLQTTSVCLRGRWNTPRPRKSLLVSQYLTLPLPEGGAREWEVGQWRRTPRCSDSNLVFRALLDTHPSFQLLFSTNLKHSELVHKPSYSLLHYERIWGQNLYWPI